jgi:hypothetical protein
MSAALALSGCTTVGAPRWGADVDPGEGLSRLGSSARSALADPAVYLPALGAAAVALSGRDAQWTDHAIEHKPVFGTADRATRLTDEYRDGLDDLWKASILVLDSGDTANEWLTNKLRGSLVQVAAINTTFAVSNLVKENTSRREPGKPPDEAEGQAALSNHATVPFARASLVRENLDRSGLPRALTVPLTVYAYGLATGSAWGRVEMGLHHVTDQLAGAAVGNFIALTVNRAFLPTAARLGVGAAADGWGLALSIDY